MKFDGQRHALDQSQPALFNRATFFWVVRNQSDAPEPQIAEDLCALLVAPQIDAEPQTLVGLDRVGAGVLQGVGADLVDDPNTATFLLLVDDDAVVFLCYKPHRSPELLPAIALR